MNKRAQFFLIAALIISGVILSFGKSYTSSRIQQTPTQVYDLSEQLQYEASQVIDNGLLRNQQSAVIEENLKNLTAYYSSINPDSDIDIIYGNETALKLISYSRENKSQGVSITDIPSSNIAISSTTQKETEVYVDTPSKKIKVLLTVDKNTEKEKKVENSFDLNRDQNFYVVIRKKVKDQDVVIYR